MKTKAEVRYTTTDGVEHCEIIDIAEYPIISLKSLSIEGVGDIPMSQVRVFEEAS